MIEEKRIIGEGGNYPLHGMLTFPDKQTGPVPAVVFVHGSGSSNMDEKVGKLTPFRDLAHGLADHGIASLRYDKRSFTYGLKMLMDKKTPITVRQETIEDAILAAELLRKDKRIDPERVFIIGHSMGGMLAPRIDAEGGNFRGLILMAGTPRRLEEVMVDQIAESMESLPGLLRSIVGKQSKKFTDAFAGMYELTDEEAKAKKMGGGTTLYYFTEMGRHPASDYLEKLDKPLLIMQGEMDCQVKADRDFGAYQALLQGKSNVEFKLYPGLNHAFVPAFSDSIAKAKKEFAVERHIGSEVVADISNWILSK